MMNNRLVALPLCLSGAAMVLISLIAPIMPYAVNSAEAADSMLKWTALETPGFHPTRLDIVRGSEVNKLLVSPTRAIQLSIVTRGAYVPPLRLYSDYTPTGTSNLPDAMLEEWGVWVNVWDAAIAPDDDLFWAAVTSSPTVDGPVEVWVTQNGGITWENTRLGLTTDFISCIDISRRYAGKRDIMVGTRDGTGLGTGKVWIRSSTPFGGWQDQTGAGSNWANPGGDVVAARFSPSYASDGCVVVVYAAAPTATPAGTMLTYGIRDLANNTTTWGSPIEIKNPASPPGASPDASTIVVADLELPSDFSGQAASLRRAYVSFYSTPKNASNENGIYRIDDNVVYVLMDTTNVLRKDISSIAYYGTYASGKLLAGERFGNPCTATVPTWFTDSPTTCPIPCWYPALKPTTGAAGVDCAQGWGYGNAQVAWSPDGNRAFVATGSACLGPFSIPNGSVDCSSPEWPDGYLNWVMWDESALAISRNNGETWNQTDFIDTEITKFTDMAVSPDCKTIYLASINANWFDQTGCDEFDSVWRSSSNPEVVAPLPATALGSRWERVLTRVTAMDCNQKQTDVALLRLVPYCQDITGKLVAWAAQGTRTAMWSPDYGDYWAIINPRNDIQDFTFESKTVLYFLSPEGLVQKMPYTGTAWATTLPDVSSGVGVAHTIAAYPEGIVLVGADFRYHSGAYAGALSQDMNTDNPRFNLLTTLLRTPYLGNVHVAFHPKFKENKTFFLADSGTSGGSAYRATPGPQGKGDARLAELDMMAAENGAVGCQAPHPVGQYGIVLSFTGEALYSAHGPASWNGNVPVGCGVDRTIDDGTGKFGPLSGMPKPGIAWDCLNVFVSPPTGRNPCFTLEPSSLKICGCCTPDSNSTLYAIDNAEYNPANRQGLLWTFTDCVAKKGPKLLTDDKMLIGCDAATGRAGEVNLCWEQLCVADGYDIEIAKNADFSLVVVDMSKENVCWGVVPVDVTKPCVFFPAGGITGGIVRQVYWDGEAKKNLITTLAEGSAIGLYGQLECGHTYYWHVKAREAATGQWIRSPWSGVRSFSVKAGVPVSAPFQGIQPFAPANGATNVSIKNPGFSWAPMGDTTKYEFILAEDAAMTKVVKQDTVSGTAYAYTGNLKYSTTYFWKVRPVEPAPGDWSPTFTFTTEKQPVEKPVEEAKPAPTPLWVWVVIAIGAILVIVTLVLIFKTRRV